VAADFPAAAGLREEEALRAAGNFNLKKTLRISHMQKQEKTCETCIVRAW
jgi:hypothetical protein